MHAGWPKFLQRAVGWASASGAVAVTMWAPLNATTPRGTVAIATDYPFGDTATYVERAQHCARPLRPQLRP